jgi:hypothetical protein
MIGDVICRHLYSWSKSQVHLSTNGRFGVNNAILTAVNSVLLIVFSEMTTTSIFTSQDGFMQKSDVDNLFWRYLCSESCIMNIYRCIQNSTKLESSFFTQPDESQIMQITVPRLCFFVICILQAELV